MINVVVEGPSDVQMARAVVRAAGREVGKVVIKRGKTNLDPLLDNYNRAAVHAPWVVFRDSDTRCPVELRRQLLLGMSELAPGFLLRLVHPMSEAWLLADAVGFASHFSIREGSVPRDPESLQNPKQTLLALCAASRSSSVRRDVVRRDGKAGPLYTTAINSFCDERWDVSAAIAVSPSLRRAVDRIRTVSAIAPESAP